VSARPRRLPCPPFSYPVGHPSTAAHRAVGDVLYREAITKANSLLLTNTQMVRQRTAG